MHIDFRKDINLALFFDSKGLGHVQDSIIVLRSLRPYQMAKDNGFAALEYRYKLLFKWAGVYVFAFLESVTPNLTPRLHCGCYTFMPE